jgi:hypothetical protein
MGVRPFICDKCEKAYISKWNMLKHQKRGCFKIPKNITIQDDNLIMIQTI